MFLHGDEWEPLPDAEGALEEISLKLQSDEDQTFLRAYRAKTATAAKGGRRRRLSFYADYQLWEIELKADAFDRQKAYHRVALYALRSEKAAHLLTGKSSVIYALNSSGGEKPAVLLDSEKRIVDYLDFFCTFVTGEEGPFLLMQNEGDFEHWADDVAKDEVPTATFDILINQRRKLFGWAVPLLGLDRSDLESFAKSPAEAIRQFSRRAKDRNPVTDSEAELSSRLRPIVFHGSQSRNGAVVGYKASATVWYGPTLFAADFLVHTSGVVEMLHDDPLGFVSRSRWSFLPVPVLGRLKSRRLLRGAEAREAVLKAAAGDDGTTREPTVFRNVRITGDFDLSRLSISRPVEMDDVEIDGNFMLDNAELAGGVKLANVRISGQLLATGMTCRSFEARSLNVSGLYDRMGPTAPEGAATAGMRLSGARIDNSTMLIGATIHGGLDLTDIRCGGVCDLSGLEVDERQPNILLSSAWSGELKGADLSRGRFGGEVRLGVGRAGGLLGASERPVKLLGGLFMRDAEIQGSLVMTGMTTRRGQGGEAIDPSRLDDDTLKQIRARLDQAGVELAFHEAGGNVLLLQDLAGRADMDLSRTRIGGSLDLGPVIVGNNRGPSHIAGNLDISDARLGGSAFLWSMKIAGNLLSDGVEIGGSLTLNEASVEGNVQANRASIGGYFLLSGAKIGNHVSLLSIRVKNMLDGNCVMGSRTEIGGEIVLSGGDFASDVRFCGARIGGAIQAITGKFQRIQIRGEMLAEPGDPQKPGEPRWRYIAPELGSILLQQVDLVSLDLQGAVVKDGIDIDNVSIEADLVMFGESPERYLLRGTTQPDRVRRFIPPAKDIRATVGGEFRTRQLRTGGDLDLSNLKCERGARFEQLEVGGNLLFRSGPKDRKREEGEVFMASLGGRIDLANAIVRGDAVLNGLSIRSDDEGKPALTLANASIDGDVCLARRDSDDGKIISIEVSKKALIDLAGIKVRTLTISANPQHAIDLTDARIESWSFAETDDGKGAALRGVLQQTTPFDPAAYVRAERWLRQRGDTGAADQIYSDMRWRATKPPHRQNETGPFRPGFLGGLWTVATGGLFFTDRSRSTLLGAFTGFWTKGGRVLFWGGSLTLLVSLMIVHLPENIAPSAPRLSESSQGMTPDQTASPKEWQGIDPLEIIIANHIPIAAIIDNPRWELADDRPLRLQIPLVHNLLPEQLAGPQLGAKRAWSISWLSPADYGLFVRVLHWIAWPLFLVGVAANMQRRRGAE